MIQKQQTEVDAIGVQQQQLRRTRSHWGTPAEADTIVGEVQQLNKGEVAE